MPPLWQFGADAHSRYLGEHLIRLQRGPSPAPAMAEPEEIFSREPDPPGLKLCRPCSDEQSGKNLVHGCDGNGCECAICALAAAALDSDQRWLLEDRIDQAIRIDELRERARRRLL